MAQILGFLVYVSGYTFIQVFLLMRLYNVPENRRKCAVIIIVSSVVFLVMEYYLGARAMENKDEISVLMYNICHMIYTFVTISVIGIYADGFLPRNFIKIFLYYDVLTTVIYGLFIRNMMHVLFEPQQLTASIFAMETMDQYPILLECAAEFILVAVIASAVNRYVDIFIGKIPDAACIAVFAAAFITYVFKIIITVNNFSKINDIESRYENMSLESMVSYMVFIVILIGAISVTILNLAVNQRRYRKALYIEAALQQDYYRAVARVNRRVRELKHDLANHAAVISALRENGAGEDAAANGYGRRLIGICDEISAEVSDQLEWRIVKSCNLSDRGRYEIFTYVSNICSQCRLDCESIRVVKGKKSSEGGSGALSEIRIKAPAARLKRLFVRRNEWYHMMKMTVESSGGTLIWAKGKDGHLLIVTV